MRANSRSRSGRAVAGEDGEIEQERPGAQSLWNAERAVSPVVGAVLIFALGFVLLAVVQTTAIPALNQQLEVQHNQRVHADVLTLGETVDRAAVTGGGGTVRIEAGLRYPPRMLFVNPPSVSGSIRTAPPAPIEIGNARANGEAGDVWNGTDRVFPTRSLVYTADYHEYRTAPTTVYESWITYNRFDDANRPLTDAGVVDGRRITLTTIDGSISRTSEGSQSIRVEPTSAPARSVMVRDASGPLTLRLPTQLTRADWQVLLAEEIDPIRDPSNDRYVSEISCQRSPPAPCGTLTLTFERDVRYELRLGRVTLGGGGVDPRPAYLVDVSGDETGVPENGSRRLVVEARDRFDNPISGVTVNTRIDGRGRVRAVSPVTGTDGRATFVFEAPENVQRTTEVTVTASFGPASQRAAATFTIRIMDLDGSRPGDGPPGRPS